MQVKKFEAKTMKEAFEMVKRHLGPEAIILSAREHGRGFGLKGVESYEITAAVSDETLRKKQFAEQKLSPKLKESFTHKPARVQKQFIEKAVARHFEDEKKTIPANITPINYAFIEDEEEVEYRNPRRTASRPMPRTNHAPVLEESAQLGEVAKSRVQNAVKRAWTAFLESEEAEQEAFQEMPLAGKRSSSVAPATEAVAAPQESKQEIQELKKEITLLRELIEGFNKVPQSFVNLHPGADYGIPYDLSFMYEKLTRSGVANEVVVEILEQAQKVLPAVSLKKRAYVDAWVAKHLLDNIKIVENRSSHRYHVLLGNPGQGKTSTLVKWASQLVMHEKKKVGIVTADVFKVGAAEQLKIYAQILNIPFAMVRQPSDWDQVDHALSACDIVLIDFPGLSLKTAEEVEWIQRMLPPSRLHPQIHGVQSVLMRNEDSIEQVFRYSKVGLHDLIFTHLDESVQHGVIMNLQNKFKLPVHSFGSGPRVPEDFEAATKERVVDLIFKLSKIVKEK